MKNGYGYFKGINGVYYNGQFKNEKREGDAVVIENGQLYSCKFEKNKLISKTKMNA